MYKKEIIKKYIFSRKFLFSLFVIFVVSYAAVYAAAKASLNPKEATSIFDMSKLEAILVPFTGYQSMLGLLAPIIACIPFSSEYVDFHLGGFEKYSIIRQGKRTWFNNIFFLSFAMGFLAFIIGLGLVSLISLMIFKGQVNPDNLSFLTTGIYKDLALKSYPLFIGANILHAGFFGGVFSVFGLMLSFFVKRKFIAWIGPFIVSHVLGMLAIKLDITQYDPATIFQTNTITSQTFLNVLFVFIVMVAFSYALSMVKFYKDIVNDHEF